MTPLNDDELNALLRRWEAPAAPSRLHPRIFQGRRWWHLLMTGSIRVPVPAAAGLLLLIALWAYWPVPEQAEPTSPTVSEPVVSLADFRPVARIEVRTVGDVK